MHNIKVYKSRGEESANIFQLNAKRDWMEETHNAHAYKCFPVTLSNTLGWGLSFPEDIVFIWDGISDSSPNHVKVISGEKYCSTLRANGTISFNTGLIFKTEEDVSLLQIPVPNYFVDGAQAFTTLISSSFFSGELPCVWKITRPFTEITIKANQPFVSLIPISLGSLNGSIVEIDEIENMPIENKGYNRYEQEKITKEILSSGKWTNFYRDAVDYKGNKIGNHEIKSLKLNVKNKVEDNNARTTK
jgi:hypothetical protein